MSQNKDPHQAQVGICVLTHADYGDALFHAAEAILGIQDDSAIMRIDLANNVAETIARLRDAVARLDNGLGVLMLTDMFGGTPTNLSLALLGQQDFRDRIEVVTGINLPMLLKALSNRHLDKDALADLVCEAGRSGIAVAGEILRHRSKKSAEA